MTMPPMDEYRDAHLAIDEYERERKWALEHGDPPSEPDENGAS